MVKSEALPILETIRSPAALADWGRLRGQTDPFMLEARAYSLVACGRLSEATGALDALAHCMARGTAWLLEMGRRAEHLKRLVERNPDAATDQLAQWETETATRLGVQDIA